MTQKKVAKFHEKKVTKITDAIDKMESDSVLAAIEKELPPVAEQIRYLMDIVKTGGVAGVQAMKEVRKIEKEYRPTIEKNVQIKFNTSLAKDA